MEPTAIFNQMMDAGIVSSDTDEDTIYLTDSFIDTINQHRDWFRKADDVDILNEIQDIAQSNIEQNQLEELMQNDCSLLPEYFSLSKQSKSFTHEQIIQMIPVLNQFQYDIPIEGVPQSFVPVVADQLPCILPLYQRSIVYCWKHNCPPCDTMKEEFGDLFEKPPDDIGLFAVYGPNWKEFLKKEYDITGAPITLFVREGRIDTRLIGPQYKSVIESEIEHLRKLS